jgi:hypothetical protein
LQPLQNLYPESEHQNFGHFPLLFYGAFTFRAIFEVHGATMLKNKKASEASQAIEATTS